MKKSADLEFLSLPSQRLACSSTSGFSKEERILMIPQGERERPERERERLMCVWAVIHTHTYAHTREDTKNTIYSKIMVCSSFSLNSKLPQPY